MTGNKGDPKKYKPGDSNIIQWSDFELANTVNSEYEDRALDLLSDRLGYLPHEGIYMPYLAHAQTLVKNATEGIDSIVTMSYQLTDLAVCIRRDDMFKGGWLANPFDEASQLRYDTQLPQYKDQARNRLSAFLFEEIPIRYSFLAEIYLRNFFTTDEYYDGISYGSHDYKAASIALYRQAYETEGQEAADNLIFLKGFYACRGLHGEIPAED